MSDSEYDSEYGDQAPEPVDAGVQKQDKPKKKPTSSKKLEQLRKDHPEYAKWCVPIVIHGDGVPCTKNHTLDTLSFESLLAKRSQQLIF